MDCSHVPAPWESSLQMAVTYMGAQAITASWILCSQKGTCRVTQPQHGYLGKTNELHKPNLFEVLGCEAGESWKIPFLEQPSFPKCRVFMATTYGKTLIIRI